MGSSSYVLGLCLALRRHLIKFLHSCFCLGNIFCLAPSLVFRAPTVRAARASRWFTCLFGSGRTLGFVGQPVLHPPVLHPGWVPTSAWVLLPHCCSFCSGFCCFSSSSSSCFLCSAFPASAATLLSSFYYLSLLPPSLLPHFLLAFLPLPVSLTSASALFLPGWLLLLMLSFRFCPSFFLFCQLLQRLWLSLTSAFGT